MTWPAPMLFRATREPSAQRLRFFCEGAVAFHCDQLLPAFDVPHRQAGLQFTAKGAGRMYCERVRSRLKERLLILLGRMAASMGAAE